MKRGNRETENVILVTQILDPGLGSRHWPHGHTQARHAPSDQKGCGPAHTAGAGSGIRNSISTLCFDFYQEEALILLENAGDPCQEGTNQSRDGQPGDVRGQ